MTLQEILDQCTIEGNNLKLPSIQLSRKQYADVKKALTNVGGKWTGGKVQSFVFEESPSKYLKDISKGVKRNVKQEKQFFATPSSMSDELVGLAGIEEHHSILEPSAGDGAIVKAIQREIEGKEVDCVEMFDLNREKLGDIDNVNLVGTDFLEFENEEGYDRIIANPPFNKNQDITHVEHMYSMLKEGGRLVAITSVTYINGSQKKQEAFKQWLSEVGACVFINQKGQFKESGTNVETATLVINKL